MDPPPADRLDWELFGEYPAQAWAAVAADDVADFCRDAAAAGVPQHCAGTSGGDALHIAPLNPLPLTIVQQAFYGPPVSASGKRSDARS